MLRNYIITAWRNLSRSKLFSMINIAGLSVSIAACILIYLYVQDELSYDKHWKNSDRIVKINWEESTDGVPNPYSVTPFMGGPLWKEQIPGVEAFTRILFKSSLTVSYENNYFNEENIFVVDSNFLSVFDFDLAAGDARTCLEEPNSAVISEAMAQKFFGGSNPIGKTLQFPKGPFKVTAVLKNTRKKSHLRPGALLRLDYDNEPIQYKDNLTWLQTYTYLKLKTPDGINSFNTKLAQWNKKVIAPILKEENIGYTVKLQSEAVTDVHFDNYYKDNFDKADKKHVLIFSVVAAFLLLIACFNFINLSTARASRRLKEVGIRKANGATRSQLIAQFMGESFVVALLALSFGLLLLFIITPYFNSFTGESIYPSLLFTTRAFLALVGILGFISFFGGIYPALYLSGFRPANILKGHLPDRPKNRRLKLSLRQMLVVSQFTISCAVIICTVLVYSQLKMMKQKDLGFNKEQVLVFRFPKLDSLNSLRAVALRSRLLAHPGIKGFATARQLFGRAGNRLFTINDKGKTGQASLNIGSIDYNYLDLLNIKLLQGRNFSREFGSDKGCFIINESAAKLMSLKDPLNAELGDLGQPFAKIIGVVKDYNYESPHTKIEPLVFKLSELGFFAFVKLAPQNISASIDLVKKDWREFFPYNPISYYFLDEKFNEQYYRNEDVMLVLLGWFSALTILVSCLGLFGLAAFVTEQRRREIAIRKVIGASVPKIVYLISKDFLKLVIAAGILASPIAYYFIHAWLQDFAYRIPVNYWIFIGTASLTTLIAFLTMSTRTISVANSNPVKSLRSD